MPDRDYAMEIIRSWREIKIMLKWKFAELRDSDFEFQEGNKESMLDHLATKLKKTRSELAMIFSDLQKY